MSLQENDTQINVETQHEEAGSGAIVPELTSQLSLVENEEAEQVNPLNDQPRMSIERPFESEDDKNEANPMSLRHARTPNYLENRKLQEIQDENSRSMGAEVDLRKSESKANEEKISLGKQLTVEDTGIEVENQNEEIITVTKEHNEEELKEETVVQNLESVLNQENIQVENDKVEEELPKIVIDQIETESIEKKSDAPVTEEGQVENKEVESKEEEVLQVSKTEDNTISNDENEANSVKSQPENLPQENSVRKVVSGKKMSVSYNKMATSGKKLLNISEQSGRKSAVISATKNTNSALNTSTKKRKFDAIQIENLQQTPNTNNEVNQQLKKVKKSETPQQLLSAKNGSQTKVHIQKFSNSKTPEMKNGFLKKSSGVKSSYSSKYMKENIPEDQNQTDSKKVEVNLNAMKLSGLKPTRSCTFCGGNFESKAEYKTLSCLHRAHNDCYTSMEKKKKAQCPLCNSNTSFVNTAPAFTVNQKIGGIKF